MIDGIFSRIENQNALAFTKQALHSDTTLFVSARPLSRQLSAQSSASGSKSGAIGSNSTASINRWMAWARISMPGVNRQTRAGVYIFQ